MCTVCQDDRNVVADARVVMLLLRLQVPAAAPQASMPSAAASSPAKDAQRAALLQTTQMNSRLSQTATWPLDMVSHSQLAQQTETSSKAVWLG